MNNLKFLFHKTNFTQYINFIKIYIKRNMTAYNRFSKILLYIVICKISKINKKWSNINIINYNLWRQKIKIKI